MVKDYSDNKRGNPLPLLYEILFYMRYSTDNIPQYLLYQSWNTGWDEK